MFIKFSTQHKAKRARYYNEWWKQVLEKGLKGNIKRMQIIVHRSATSTNKNRDKEEMSGPAEEGLVQSHSSWWNFPCIQWLTPHALKTGGMGLILGWGTQIPCASLLLESSAEFKKHSHSGSHPQRFWFQWRVVQADGFTSSQGDSNVQLRFKPWM